jgi:hypothetical protein
MEKDTATVRKLYGRYIVADPEICHGKLTFEAVHLARQVFLARFSDTLEPLPG